MPEPVQQDYSQIPGGPGFVRAEPGGCNGDETGPCLAHGRDEARPSPSGAEGKNVLILAVEFSTDEAGVALVDGEGRVRASAGVAARNRRSQDLFPAAERVLAEAGARWEDVDVFAAGTGPGSYTGLRVSVTAARGWALVRERRVWTASSAAALAAEYFAENPEWTAVGVWGDARRGTVWAGRFERVGSGVRQVGEWAVARAEEREGLWPGLAWVQSGGEGGRAPKAEWVGRLCAAGGMASGGLEPIYVHAAVNVAPRFDGEGRLVGG